MEIGYCIDCKELNYASTNRNGVFERANMSNNHIGHRQIVFGEPNHYTPPIRNVLTKIKVGESKKVKRRIFTCYGCPHFYKDKGDKYATKHCGKDHLKCDHYWK